MLTAGLARTAMAAMGMREFLIWDHDNVIAETVVEEVIFALAAFLAAAIVAAGSRLMFVGQPRAP